nr:hypothetical protein JVH1_4618 [Rhodococcus sp. JVH1]
MLPAEPDRATPAEPFARGDDLPGRDGLAISVQCPDRHRGTFQTGDGAGVPPASFDDVPHVTVAPR